MPEEKLPWGQHILKRRIQDCGQFIARIDSLLADLASSVRVSTIVLTSSIDYVAMVDEHARRIIVEEGADTAISVFQQVTAFVGEYVIRHVGGKWICVPSIQHSSQQEPWIAISPRRRIAPFLIVYEELIENPAGGSLVAGVMSVTR